MTNQQHANLTAFLNDLPSGTPYGANRSGLTPSMLPSLSQSSMGHDEFASMFGANMDILDSDHIPTGAPSMFGLPSSAVGNEMFDGEPFGMDSMRASMSQIPYGYDRTIDSSYAPPFAHNNQPVPLSPARTGQGTIDMGSYSYPDSAYHQRILQYHMGMAQGHLGQKPHSHGQAPTTGSLKASRQPALSLQERRRQKRLAQQQTQAQPMQHTHQGLKRSASATDHPDIHQPSTNRPRLSAPTPTFDSTDMTQMQDGLVHDSIGIMHGAADGATAPDTLSGLPAAPDTLHGLQQPYSSSGFDMVKALAKVATRPDPIVNIGPVDDTCSFTVVDVDLPDQPIIYCSDTFLRLTGYERHEVLGRNCRFLQAPAGLVEKGSERCATDHQAVEHLAKFSSQRKDCQASLINYRKDGHPFINLVTIVPITWDEPDQIKYLVGFQIDLVEQPGSIVEKRPDGSYFVNYSSNHASVPPLMAPSSSHHELRKSTGNATIPMSPEELAKQRKLENIQNVSDAVSGTFKDGQKWAKLVLENSHDLIYVLSLKGTVLYVSPSVEQILGFQPHELTGCSIADFTHPSDVVPVFRELKDSTSNASIAASARSASSRRGRNAKDVAPAVNLLFRMRCKNNTYRWIESSGKLHLEQGKGRKVVISTGRLRPVYHLSESMVTHNAATQMGFWTRISTGGLFLNVLPPVANILRLGPGQLMGRKFADLVDPAAVSALNQAVSMPYPTSVLHTLPTGDGSTLPIISSFYPSPPKTDETVFGVPHMSVWTHMARVSPEQLAHLVPNVVMAFDSNSTVADDTESDNTFSEMTPLRGSSWCYELHLLKNTNRRLKEDLRAAHKKRTASRMASSTSTDPSSPSGRRGRRTPKAGLTDAGIRDLLYGTSPAPKKSRTRSSSDEASGNRSSESSSSSHVREGSLSTCATSVLTSEPRTKSKRPYTMTSGPSTSSKSSSLTLTDNSPPLSRDGSGSGSS